MCTLNQQLLALIKIKNINVAKCGNVILNCRHLFYLFECMLALVDGLIYVI